MPKGCSRCDKDNYAAAAKVTWTSSCIKCACVCCGHKPGNSPCSCTLTAEDLQLWTKKNGEPRVAGGIPRFHPCTQGDFGPSSRVATVPSESDKKLGIAAADAFANQFDEVKEEQGDASSQVLYRGVARMAQHDPIYDQPNAILFSSYALASMHAQGFADGSTAHREEWAGEIRARMVTHLDVEGLFGKYWGDKDQTFTNRKYLFQQRYSGAMDGFYDDMRVGLELARRGKPFPDREVRRRQQAALFNWVDLEADFDDATYKLCHNPVVSCGTSLDHAIKYGAGLKSYHGTTPCAIDFESLLEGKAQVLGSLQVLRIPTADLQQRHINVCTGMHEAKDILLNKNHILSEQEVSFWGFIESRYAHRKPLFDITIPPMEEYIPEVHSFFGWDKYDEWEAWQNKLRRTLDRKDNPQVLANMDVKLRQHVHKVHTKKLSIHPY